MRPEGLARSRKADKLAELDVQAAFPDAREKITKKSPGLGGAPGRR